VRKFVILYIALCLVIIIGFAELICRFIQPPGSFTTLSYDPDVGWRYRANINLKIGDSRFITNSCGFRGRNYSKNKPDDTERIVFLGDSYAAGIGFEPYPALLEKNLNSLINSGWKYEVINASVSAWATDQQYIYLREEGISYHPDIVILNTVPNDIKENYTRGMVGLEGGKLIERGIPSISLPKNLFWYLSGHSYIFQMFQNICGTRYGYFDGLNLHPWWKGGLTYTDLFKPKLTENGREAFQLYEILLKKIRDLCSENGAQLLLLITPAKVELSNGSEEIKNPDGTIVFSGGWDNIPPGQVSNIIASLAEELGIKYINMYNLMTATPSQQKYFLSQDFHFNRKGHEFIARQISAYLNKNRDYQE